MSRRREPLVYWEKQGADRMCALHCLNSLLQGPYFTDAVLSSIGSDLDKKERQLITDGSSATDLLGEGSGNAAADGYYNISVLIECLRTKRLSCVIQKSVAEVEYSGRDVGYILNQSDHWIALRKVNGQWYNLDSMKPAPTAVTEFFVSSFLASLKERGYTAFVVHADVGGLPEPGAMQTKQSNQYYLTQNEIEEMHREEAKREEENGKNAFIAEGNSTGSSYLVQGGARNAPHTWPEGNGHSLGASFTPNASEGAAPRDIAFDDGLEEDPELREAIRLSMQTYKEELPCPPEEPSVAEGSAHLLLIRLPTGRKISRRFRTDAHMMDVCDWIVYESHNEESIPALTIKSCFTLVQTFPKRKFCRVQNSIVLIADSSEGVDVTKTPLADLDFDPQQQMMLQL